MQIDTSASRLVLAVGAAQVAAFAGWAGSPIVVGALVDGLGISEGAAATLAAAELTSLAVTALLSAGLVAHRSRRAVGLTGIGLALFGHALSALTPGYATLVILRSVAGVGEGLVLAAGNAAAAGARNPDRIFAAVTVMTGLAAAIELTLLPHATSILGAGETSSASRPKRPARPAAILRWTLASSAASS